jgi:uncharacterized protein
LVEERLTRREFLQTSLRLAAGGAAAAFLGGVYVYRLEPEWIEKERLVLPIPNLPDSFSGTKLVHFSDIHFGAHMSSARAARIIRAINAENADLVMYTGDFVSRLNHGEAGQIETHFSQIRARRGVYAILGNHDHWADAGIVARAARAAGITLLRNQGTLIDIQGESLWIAGVDDIWEKRHDLKAALDGVPPSTPIILLAHEPDFADEVAADGRVALQLSGHSHGGQVVLPYFGAPILPYLGTRYPAGLYSLDGMWLYTNRGIGLAELPVRLNCRPELTIIELISERDAKIMDLDETLRGQIQSPRQRRSFVVGDPNPRV